jgi:hypothetical protein
VRLGAAGKRGHCRQETEEFNCDAGRISLPIQPERTSAGVRSRPSRRISAQQARP